MSWKEFEELAAQIYRELSLGAAVKHNDKVQGIDSGVLRQIDVSVRFSIAGHGLLTVIQAKDYDRPADINVVGEFATVIKDIRANKGILICRSGFTDGATKLAQNLGIDLCNIHDAQSRDWALEIQLPVLWIDLLPQLRFGLGVQVKGGDTFPRDINQWALSPDNGQTRIDLTQSFAQAWNDGYLSREVGNTYQFHDPNAGRIELAVTDEAGEHVWRPVNEFTVTYTVLRRSWLGTFSPEECRGILNYVDGSFTVSHLPIGSIPKARDASWKEVDNPENLAISISGTVITTEGWQIIPDSARFESAELQFFR